MAETSGLQPDPRFTRFVARVRNVVGRTGPRSSSWLGCCPSPLFDVSMNSVKHQSGGTALARLRRLRSCRQSQKKPLHPPPSSTIGRFFCSPPSAIRNLPGAWNASPGLPCYCLGRGLGVAPRSSARSGRRVLRLIAVCAKPAALSLFGARADQVRPVACSFWSADQNDPTPKARVVPPGRKSPRMPASPIIQTPLLGGGSSRSRLSSAPDCASCAE